MSDADPAHFAWQTEGPYFAENEARLISNVRAVPGERFLEMGCGEGGNLHHLRALDRGRFGIDLSPAKAAFARQATGAHTACADACALPFKEGAFDALLIRDLLHHLQDRRRALDEARRVLKPGGRLTLIEPNRRAPLVFLQAALLPSERGAWASTAKRIRAELEEVGFQIESMQAMQPFPLARVVLHPWMGSVRLGSLPVVQRALDRLDRAAQRLVPERMWLYLAFNCVRPA